MKLNKNNICPVGARILVKIQEKPQETDGGIILTDGASNTAPVMGEVIAKGKNSQFDKKDIVLFRRYSVDELKIPNDSGEEDVVYFLEDGDILGTVQQFDREIKNKYKAIADKKAAKNNDKEKEISPEKGSDDE